MAEAKNILTGERYTTADVAISISVERYNELIKEEAILDKLMECSDIDVYSYRKTNKGGLE